MNVWKEYLGKKIFLRTVKDRIYIGVVKDITDLGDNIIFFSLTTSKGWVTVLARDIAEIKEELDYGEQRSK